MKDEENRPSEWEDSKWKLGDVKRDIEKIFEKYDTAYKCTVKSVLEGDTAIKIHVLLEGESPIILFYDALEDIAHILQKKYGGRLYSIVFDVDKKETRLVGKISKSHVM